MLKRLLPCVLGLLSACGAPVPEDRGDLDEPAIDVADPGKADGVSLAMGTYTQDDDVAVADLPAAFSLLRNGRALFDKENGRYTLGATTLLLYDADGTLAYRLAWALGPGTKVSIKRPSRNAQATFSPSPSAYCETAADCEPQNLTERDCMGTWTCETNHCAFACFASSSLTPWDSSVGAAACARVWAAGLHRCDRQPDRYVVVSKSARNAVLCDHGALVENAHIGLGQMGDKVREGDERTPEGTFYFARKIPVSQYRRALLVSYPSAEDAARGRASGLIDAATAHAIVAANDACTEPPQQTALGGLVELHGGAGGVDWTWGCVALSNPQIDRFYAQLGRGDTVVIEP